MPAKQEDAKVESLLVYLFFSVFRIFISLFRKFRLARKKVTAPQLYILY